MTGLFLLLAGIAVLLAVVIVALWRITNLLAVLLQSAGASRHTLRQLLDVERERERRRLSSDHENGPTN